MPDMPDNGSSYRTRTGERVTVTRRYPTSSRQPIGRPQPRAERRGHDHQEVEIPEAFNLSRDRVRWGPIVAGLLTALTTLLLLGLLGVGVGFNSTDAAAAATQGGPAPEAWRNAAVWAALSGMIAFALGGFVAGWSAAIFDRKWGALNGALVFLLAVPVALWLAGQGFGAILGTFGNFAAGLNVDPGAAQGAAQGATDQARQAAGNLTPGDAARAAETARNTAWASLLGLLMALLASSLGGFLGTRRELEVDEATGQVHD